MAAGAKSGSAGAFAGPARGVGQQTVKRAGYAET